MVPLHSLAARRTARLDLVVSLALATLPPPLIAALLSRVARDLPRRLAERLTDLAGKRLLIVPDELPYAFLLSFPHGRLAITLLDPAAPPATDAQMHGPLRLFFDLVRGGGDGDALFFSRELAITGDMAAAVALRNAMDGAGVDLLSEFLDLPAPFGTLLRHAGALADGCAAVLLGPLAGRTARLEAELAALRGEVRRLKEGAAKPRMKSAAAPSVAPEAKP